MYSTETLWYLWGRIAQIHASKESYFRIGLNFISNFSWRTQWNAYSKLRNTEPIWLWLSRAPVRSWIVSSSCILVDSPFRKLCCHGLMMLLASRNAEICLNIMCSSNFPHAHNKIGLYDDTSELFLDLGIEIIFAYFYSLRTLPLHNDCENITDKYLLHHSAYRTRNALGIALVPGDNFVSMFSTNDRTPSSETLMSSMGGMLYSDRKGRAIPLSLVNTEMK